MVETYVATGTLALMIHSPTTILAPATRDITIPLIGCFVNVFELIFWINYI